MKRGPMLRMVATGTLGLLLLTSMFTGAFFLTEWLYHIIGSTPPAFLVQVINSLLGVVFCVLFLAGLSLIELRPGARARRMGLFEPIFEAIEHIAKGDFHLRLDPTLGNNVFTSELAKSVNRMAEELNQMEHLRQEFISTVSHEIQSPLTSIRGFAQELYDEHLSAENRRHYLSIIETESMRLSRMADNMLKLASLEQEHVKVEAKSYRLDKQIRTVILTYEPQWTTKTLDMEIALEAVEILADEVL